MAAKTYTFKLVKVSKVANLETALNDLGATGYLVVGYDAQRGIVILQRSSDDIPA